MSGKSSFVFYRSFYEALSPLPDLVKVRLFDAICDYSLNGVEPELEGVEKSIFILIRPQIDVNAKRYENGKKGGRPPKSEDFKTENKPRRNQNETKPEPNVNDNANVNDKEVTNVTIDDQKLSPVVAQMFFERVWNAYHGQGAGGTGAAFKGSRKKAFDKFTVLLKREKDHEEFTQRVTEGAKRYGDFIKQSGGYSKHVTTWLNAEGWNDDYGSKANDRPPQGAGLRPGAITLRQGIDAGEEAKALINKRI